jgi:hypothetical protein
MGTPVIYSLPKVFSPPLTLVLSPVGERGDKRKERLANPINPKAPIFYNLSGVNFPMKSGSGGTMARPRNAWASMWVT